MPMGIKMAIINCIDCENPTDDKIEEAMGDVSQFDDSANEMKLENINSEVTYQQADRTDVKSSKKLKKIIFLSAIVIIAAAFTAFVVNFTNTKNAEKQYRAEFNNYIDNLWLLKTTSIDSVVEAEDLHILTMNVWRNTIYKNSDSTTDKYTRPDGKWVDDFNVALKDLFVDAKSRVSSISADLNTVKRIYRDLQNPPKGLENCYETAKGLYEAYYDLANIAMYPNGSYKSVSEKWNEINDTYLKHFNQIDIIIPEKLR